MRDISAYFPNIRREKVKTHKKNFKFNLLKNF